MKFGLSKLLPKKPVKQPSRRRPARTNASRMIPFGYYSGAVQRTTPEQLERSKTARNAPPERSRLQYLHFLKNRFGMILIVLALIASGLNMVRLSDDVTVESMNTADTGFVLHDADTYQQAAQAYLGDSLFNGNKITVNTTAVENRMMEQFPELTSVRVALPIVSHRPVVYIRVAEPSFILVSNSGQSYVVDETGRALAATTQMHHLDQLHLPTVQDESGLPLKRGDVVLPAAASLFVREVTHQFAAKKLGIARMQLPAASSELDVYPKGRSYFIKFNLQNDSARQQAGTYFAVIEKLQHDGKMPKKYVDVRIDGRAYYR